jgi:hypothetical protein
MLYKEGIVGHHDADFYVVLGKSITSLTSYTTTSEVGGFFFLSTISLSDLC